MLKKIFFESAVRTFWIGIVVVPLLVLVEYFNHRYGDRLLEFFEKRKRTMPFWAAVLGMLPGCNLAAATAVLYAKKYVSMGALVAAMIATSDEAIYVFIPQKFNFLPLFGAKFLLALIVGFSVDLFLNFHKKARIPIGHAEFISASDEILNQVQDDKKNMERDKSKEKKDLTIGACCSIHEHKAGLKGKIEHALKHGIKIVLFVFAVLFAFNLLKDLYGLNAIASSVLATGKYQPVLAGLIGLIPGCGTSVILATLYTQGILTFAGALAGLSVASGDAVIVLLANKVSKKDIAKIIGIVLFSGIIVGYLVQVLFRA